MITSKQILTGVGIAFAVTGGILAYQFYRLQQFTINPKSIERFSANMNKISFDVYFDFKNNSDLQIALAYQNYQVYINGRLVTTIESKTPQVILANGTSLMKVSVELSPRDLLKKLGTSNLDNILKFREQNLKIDAQMGVMYLGFTIPITTTMQDKIQNWITPTPTK
jgi:LEA14-like dessication related protein